MGEPVGFMIPEPIGFMVYVLKDKDTENSLAAEHSNFE